MTTHAASPAAERSPGRWLIWAVYVTLWTTALVIPVPPTGLPVDDFIELHRFLIDKTVHVSAYVVLTALTGWLTVPARYRLLLLFFVMAHGTATELTQWGLTTLGISERTGMLYDVGFDNVGVLIGLLLSWKWWTKDYQPAAASTGGADGAGTAGRGRQTT
jgi:hypothetical protein